MPTAATDRRRSDVGATAKWPGEDKCGISYNVDSDRERVSEERESERTQEQRFFFFFFGGGLSEESLNQTLR